MSARSSRKYQYSRGIMGLPSLFVAVCWLAIWLVWTSIDSTTPAGRARIVTRTVFSQPVSANPAEMDPRDIIRLQRGSDEMDAPSSAAISRYVAEPKYLERPAREATAGGGAPYGRVLRRNAVKGATYRPDWREAPVFVRKAPGKPKPLVECSDQLELNGFQLPQMVLIQLGLGKAPWQVVVHLETDENGRVEHVFLDRGSDDSLVNKRVVQAMYRGRLVTKGARCEGTITVSFPGE
ncbi:hypothetical protein ACFLQU_02600 [Verrucomicrobiota bacterium]